MRITAVIVTYNRKALLMRCLNAVMGQTRKPNHILIVDNASTDGTHKLLESEGWLSYPGIELLALNDNTGGAGGFSKGLKQAIDKGADWTWMMDDDAEPHTTALSELMHVVTDPRNIYGSLAVNGDETSWLTTLLGEQNITINQVSDIPKQARVSFVPFLGFLIHRSLVDKIGYPDAGYFIAADDVEYCIRAQKAGAQIIIAGNSHIEHPKSRPYQVKLPGYTLTALELPPWKRYYDTRNRLLIARKYYGLKLFTHTIPGSFVRLLAALVKEPRKLAQLKAFSAGMFDGLMGIKGKRHETWGIK
ncbi:glycosyltransferase family 2 protein [Azonexus sp.]|uniref:glycosyltransferase family 2 protein n=1 Tax=Azonexus sp. TaxID=1872668 RepID=UPI0035B45731